MTVFDMPRLTGVLLVSMSLCCDAIIGNVQEAALKNSHEPSARVVLYSYGLGFLCIMVFLLVTGSLLPGTFFFLEALICYSLPLYYSLFLLSYNTPTASASSSTLPSVTGSLLPGSVFFLETSMVMHFLRTV
jgi:adenosine 3'-phospho 5'-phosphosulfate transporter B3